MPKQRIDNRHRGKATTRSHARWLSDLHCLWCFCGQSACRRARACRRDVHKCLPALALVPVEAREFIFGWDEALAQGLGFDEMMQERAGEWQTLMRWRELVASAVAPGAAVPACPAHDAAPTDAR